jgi:hypothetical protein
MSKRTCKCCGLEKEHNYSHLNSASRAVYLDERNLPWNGKVCSSCKSRQNKKAYVRKTPQEYTHVCIQCKQEFKSMQHNKKYCTKPVCQASKKDMTDLKNRLQKRRDMLRADKALNDQLEAAKLEPSKE